MTPEQDGFLQQHTIQIKHTRKKNWTRRGKLYRLFSEDKKSFFEFKVTFEGDIGNDSLYTWIRG